MKRCKAESTSGDEGATSAPTLAQSKKRLASFPLEMHGNLSSFPTSPSSSVSTLNLIRDALVFSLMFGGGGSTRAASQHAIRMASPHPVARSSRGRVLVLPTRFRDATLIDPSNSASVRACGKLRHSVWHNSVTSMSSMLPIKEELAELPAAQNTRYSNVDGFGVGDIVWMKCRKDQSVWSAVVVERKQEAPLGVICVIGRGMRGSMSA